MSTFILKWNPEISSFKYPQYLGVLADPFDFSLNWSFHDWREVKEGDRVFFLRVGERPQLLASGYITGVPYQDEDWSGRGREVYYADFYFDIACHPEYEHVLTADDLEKAVPGFDWRAGHSGVMLDGSQAEALELLWISFQYDCREDFSREYDFPEDEEDYEDEEEEKEAEEWAAEDSEEDDDEDTVSEEDFKPFVGIIGYSGNSFSAAYGDSDEISRFSVLQRILSRRHGEACQVCGYDYRQVFGDGCVSANRYLYVPQPGVADWEKAFVCVCQSCEKVLHDDPKRFLRALNGE